MDSPKCGLKQVGATFFMKMTALSFKLFSFFSQFPQISSELHGGVAQRSK